MLASLKYLASVASSSFVRKAEYIEPRLKLISLLAVISFPLYFVIWQYIFPQPYENLTLRLLGSALFIPFLFVPHWPAWLIKYKTIYWYFATLYGLPFFFTFMLLENNGSTVWLLSALIAVFLMILILDWFSLLIQFGLGVSLAWLASYYLGDTANADLSSLQYSPIFLFAIVAGIATNYSAEMLQQERRRAMLVAASNIAHEVRTPLLGIKSGAAGLQQFLPTLLEAYRMAHEQGLPVKPIRLAHLHSMQGVLERIESEADHSNVIVDMLLMNTSIKGFSSKKFTFCSIVKCMEIALQRYPFASEKERQLVLWSPDADFDFRGAELLMVHVFFNLLKNALYHIAKAGKGNIYIQISKTTQSNLLVFRDTGSGIPPDVLPNIFTRFYSKSADKNNGLGAGIGLAFCRSVMSSFNGTITCNSQAGEFTEFVLTFPIQDSL